LGFETPDPVEGLFAAVGLPAGRVGAFTLPPFTEPDGLGDGLAAGLAVGLDIVPRDAECCIRCALDGAQQRQLHIKVSAPVISICCIDFISEGVCVVV
jgi:hypothetical protein